MSKHFLILEVKDVVKSCIHSSNGLTECVPADENKANPGYREVLNVHESRIIDGDRLRYSRPKTGEVAFNDSGARWHWGEYTHDNCPVDRLILDPAKPEQTDNWYTELDKILANNNICSSARSALVEHFKKWKPAKEE